MLANGKSLITSVVPSALLHAARSLMRTRFSAVICKRVQTLEFTKAAEQGESRVQQMIMGAGKTSVVGK